MNEKWVGKDVGQESHSADTACGGDGTGVADEVVVVMVKVDITRR